MCRYRGLKSATSRILSQLTNCTMRRFRSIRPSRCSALEHAVDVDRTSARWHRRAAPGSLAVRRAVRSDPSRGEPVGELAQQMGDPAPRVAAPDVERPLAEDGGLDQGEDRIARPTFSLAEHQLLERAAGSRPPVRASASAHCGRIRRGTCSGSRAPPREYGSRGSGERLRRSACGGKHSRTAAPRSCPAGRLRAK